MKFVRRVGTGVVLAAAICAGVMYAGGPAGAAPAHPAEFGGAAAYAPVLAATATSAVPTPNRPRWWRETVKPGARDTGPYAISHVYEVQIRLARSGVYRGPVNGSYGSPVVNAVKAFQKGQKLPQTGTVDQTTWARLIWYSTLRSLGWYSVPAICRSSGFHACYSRSTNELFLFANGTLWNSWLVRGGAQGLTTVLGNYRVYWRDIDHKSHEFHNAPMPFAQFFYGGEAIHGSGEMVNPLVGHSHGCINLYIKDADQLWHMTAGATLTVTVYGAWR